MHPQVYTRTVSHVRSPPASGQFSALPLLIAPKPLGLPPPSPLAPSP